ncbi:hypothetical protein [Vibrio vulnificus]|uniref:hypothetical protein n=1 Tax=Vibrio vulnificus TaxID=672 RepID=UPI0019D43B77|nr:hypothetical protein [Vibrio vulnificus]MBN8130992.1 hypothetical protein [Vibrio vulnificus]MBN8159657.1 hypothetical protein [Vibrio vulnificus]HDY8172470.1 hypothetical protein [Vibrio vulnificus]
MTKKKLDSPLVNQWLIELDAVIRHEVLHYLVESRAIDAGDFFFDPSPFMTIDGELMNALFVYMDRLDEAEEDTELAELISSVGSLRGLNATKRFLDEHDFLFQVIEKTSIKDLSRQAQNALTNKYPIAIRTVEYLMEQTGANSLPRCLKSAKLNECFSIENLGFENDLEKILVFHTKIVKNHRNAKKVYQSKPRLFTSNKKYEFIDIEMENNNNEKCINVQYKLYKIAKLNNKYRQQVLAYCEELVKHHIDLYSSTENQTETSDIPIPPPENMLAPRYDGYLPYIIGLYCIKNMSKYKEVKNLEYDIEFDGFRHFIKVRLFDKFDFIQEEFMTWHSKNNTKNYLNDINTYISDVLIKRFNANIRKTQCLINKYEKLYFPSEDT